MAELDKLFYALGLKDETDKDLDKIKKKLEGLGTNVKINLDVKTLSEELKKSFDNVFAQIGKNMSGSIASGMSNADSAGITKLRDEIQKKLSDISFSPSFEGAKAGLNDLIILAQRLEDHLTRIPAAMEVVRKTIENVNAALAKLDSATTSAGGINTKQQEAEMLRLEKTIKRVNDEINKQSTKNAGIIDNKQVEAGIDKLRVLRDTLLQLQRDGNAAGFKAMRLDGSIQSQITQARTLIQTGQEQVREEEKLARAKERAAQIEEKKSQAMRNTLSISQKMEQSFSMQSGILGQLGMQIENVFSIYTLERFLQKVVETGGELEKQRLAMSSILGSDFLSNRLMDQVQALAVKSPFGVMQLNSYAKQLVAFGVETDQLYESLKRLADIAAGVGVDMQRVAYAFGQVKSRSWLDAKELRQFAYAGIPLLEELSKYYTAAERAKGSDKTISTRDVRGMIQNREVSFEDMRSVLWEMTDEGGRFYKMQEVMSESLAAKYKNLADSYDIMVAEIAKSNNAAFKAPAEILTILMQNWEKLLPILGTATMLLVANKAQWYAQTIAMSLNSKAELRKIASSRKLNVAQKLYITTSKQMTASDLAELASTGALNRSQLARLAVLKKMTAAEVDAAVANNTFARSEYVAAAAGTKAAFSLRGLGAAFKSFFASLGPFGWITLAVGAVAELATAWISSSNAEKEALSNLRKYATESADTLSSVLDNVHRSNASGLSETRAKEEYDKAVEDLSAYYGKEGVAFLEQGLLDAEGNAISSYTERLKKLEEELKKLKEYGEDTDATASAITGVFDDLDDHDLEEWISELNQQRKAMKDFADESPQMARKAFENINKELRLGIREGASFGEYIDKFFSDDKILLRASKILNAYTSDIKYDGFRLFTDNFKTDYEEYNQYFQDLKTGIEREYKKVFKDDSFSPFNATAEQKAKIVADIKAELDDSSWTDDQKELFMKGLYKTFHWTVEVDTKVNNGFSYSAIEGLLNSIKNDKKELAALNKAFGKSGAKPLSDASMSYTKGINDVKDRIKNAYKSLQDTYSLSEDAVNSLMDEDGKKTSGNKNGGENKAERQMRQYFQSLQKEINLIEKFYQRYKELSAKIGKERAAAILNGNPIFKDIVANGKAVTDYGSFNKILKDEQTAVEEGAKKYSKVNGAKEQAENILSSLNEKMLGNDTDAISRAVDIASKTMKAYVDELNKQYDIYKKVYETTGDQSLASIMAFGTPDAIREGAQKYRDALLGEIKKLLPGVNEEILRGFYNMEPEDISASVSKRDDEDEKAYAARLKNITLLTEEFRKVDEKDAQERVSLYLKAVEDTMTYYEKMEQEIREGERKIQAVRELAGDEEAKKIKRRMEADRLFDQVANSPATKNLAASYLSMSKEYVSTYADSLRNDLVNAFAEGTKSAEDFRKELEAINKIEQDSNNRTSNIVAFAQGGLNGLFENLKKKSASDVANASATLEKTMAMRDKGLATDADVSLAKSVLEEKKQSDVDLNDSITNFTNGINVASLALQALTGVFDGFRQVFEQFSSFFESVGNKDAANRAGNIADGIGAVSQIFAPASDILQNAMSMNIGGIISSAISAPFKTIMAPWQAFNELHDKKKQQEIDKSKEKVDELGSAYDRLTKTIERQLGVATGAQAHQQINNLKQQRDEILKQQQLEEDKKNSDEQALEDYKTQIADLDDQIKYFYEDLFSDDFAANVKEWAGNISDSIVDSWSRGEDAARAYDKTVGEILKNMASEALKHSIMEPAMEKVRQMLYNERDGFLSNGTLTNDEMMRIADELMNIKGVEAKYAQSLDDLDAMVYSKYGFHLFDDERSGLTGSIEGTTEETADLLASYLNAARADISIIRGYLQQYFDSEDAVSISAINAQQLQQLEMIALSTERNAVAAEQIQTILDNVTSGTKQFSVA